MTPGVPLSASFLTPIGQLRIFLKALSAQLLAPFSDPWFRTLNDLLSAIEIETTQAFSQAKPEMIREAAIEVGRSHVKLLGSLLGLTEHTMAALNIPEAVVLEAGEKTAIALTSAPDAFAFPTFSQDARVCCRAAFILLRELPTISPRPSIRDVAGAIAAEESPSTLAYVGLVEGLLVGGMNRNIPAANIDAMALELWRVIRDGEDEELIEDSYLAAMAIEGRRDPSGSVALEDLPHTLQ